MAHGYEISGGGNKGVCIIMDLEWNSAYCSWQQRFLNEIIEIGAVKLDGHLNEVGRFRCFVRSRLTRKLRGRFKGLTNISNEDMRSGIDFDEAIKRYTEWAGEDTLTLTWSNSDIYALLDNMKTLLDTDTIPFLYRYADVQKYVQERLGVTGNQISLTAAAELAGVSFEEFAAHRALGDCLCSAELLRRTWVDGGLDKYTIDASTGEYYRRLMFKPYLISDLNDPLVDKAKLRFKCPVCGIYLKRRGKWQFKNRWHRADFVCSGCGRSYCGRVRFKKLYDSVAVTENLSESPAAQGNSAKPSDVAEKV